MRIKELSEFYENPTNTREGRIKASIECFQDYMSTYGIDTCGGTSRVFIDDILYILGVALDPSKYRWAGGYESFKKDLSEYLTEGKDIDFSA